MGGERRVTSEIFRDSNGFGVSYRFVGMITIVPHGPGLKQNFSVHTRCSNLFPRFLVYAEFNKRHLLISGHSKSCDEINSSRGV